MSVNHDVIRRTGNWPPSWNWQAFIRSARRELSARDWDQTEAISGGNIPCYSLLLLIYPLPPCFSCIPTSLPLLALCETSVWLVGKETWHITCQLWDISHSETGIQNDCHHGHAVAMGTSFWNAVFKRCMTIIDRNREVGIAEGGGAGYDTMRYQKCAWLLKQQRRSKMNGIKKVE